MIIVHIKYTLDGFSFNKGWREKIKRGEKMSDYEEFERQCEEQREENRKLLKEFAEWLSAKGLSEGTIYKHVTNIDFYINECLLYDDVDTPADGIGAIGYFLGYWFIRKAMWASRRTIRPG